MKCFSCGNEVARMYPDGCQTCHDINSQTRGSDRFRASLARVESGTAAAAPSKPVFVSPVKKKPVEPKKPDPMPSEQIRWTPEEQQQVANEVSRLFPGLPFAAKAIKQAQLCLPADRRKPSIGPLDLKKIRALIPGAKSPRTGGATKAIAKVSRRATAAPVVLEPVAETLPAAESLADSIAQQLFGAVINVGISALEKAAGRLRNVAQ